MQGGEDEAALVPFAEQGLAHVALHPDLGRAALHHVVDDVAQEDPARDTPRTPPVGTISISAGRQASVGSFPAA